MRFSKSDPGPFGMLKQVFVARLVPVVTRFGLRKIPKCLEKGLFWEQQWVKKTVKNALFQKSSSTIWDAETSVFSPF